MNISFEVVSCQSLQIVDEDVSVDDVVEKIESFEDEVSDARC